MAKSGKKPKGKKTTKIKDLAAREASAVKGGALLVSRARRRSIPLP